MPKFESCRLNGVARIEKKIIHTNIHTSILTHTFTATHTAEQS